MRCCIQSVGDLQPGHSTVIPFMINAVPILFVVQRYSRPDHDRCTVALVSCDAGSLGFHRCKPEPPKLKFETALELLDVRLDRLKDEAFWCAAPWLAHSPTHSPTHLLTHSRTYLPTYPPEHHRPFLMPRPSVISALTRTSIPTPNLYPDQGGGMADQGTAPWQQLNTGAADVPAATRFPCGGLIGSGMLRHPMASPAAPPAVPSSASPFQHQRLLCTLRVPCHRLCCVATSSAAPHPSCTRLATQGRTGGWRGTVRVTTLINLRPAISILLPLAPLTLLVRFLGSAALLASRLGRERRGLQAPVAPVAPTDA